MNFLTLFNFRDISLRIFNVFHPNFFCLIDIHFECEKNAMKVFQWHSLRSLSRKTDHFWKRIPLEFFDKTRFSKQQQLDSKKSKWCGSRIWFEYLWTNFQEFSKILSYRKKLFIPDFEGGEKHHVGWQKCIYFNSLQKSQNTNNAKI